jgi:thiaminase (transcriptional activator TenA)
VVDRSASDPAGRTFAGELWASIGDVYAAILEHPFVVGLSDGSLDREAFAFFVVQDAHYLRGYARALSVAAARAPAEADIAMFAQHAAGAIAVERELHESFFREFGLSEQDVADTPVAPTNLAYTSYLLASAYGGSFAELLGAVLPCYWIYWEVGKELVKHGSPDSRYQRWIDTYGGEQFGLVVQEVLNASDELANDLTGHERDRLFLRFGTTARYEWMFWDMGYREEWWPI